MKDVLEAIGATVGVPAEKLSGAIGEDGSVNVETVSGLFKSSIDNLKTLAINEGKTLGATESSGTESKKIYESIEAQIKEATGGLEVRISDGGLTKAFDHFKQSNNLTDDKVQNSEFFTKYKAKAETDFAAKIKEVEDGYALKFKSMNDSQLMSSIQSLVATRLQENQGFMLPENKGIVENWIKDVTKDVFAFTGKDEQGNYFVQDSEGKIAKNDLLQPLDYNKAIEDAMKGRIPFKEGATTRTGSYGKHDDTGDKNPNPSKKLQFERDGKAVEMEMPTLKNDDELITWIEQAGLNHIPRNVIDAVDDYYTKEFEKK